MNKSDVIVIGAGAVGSASAYFLARAGKKVTVLEKKDSCSLVVVYSLYSALIATTIR